MDKARSCANRCIFCFVDQMAHQPHQCVGAPWTPPVQDDAQPVRAGTPCATCTGWRRGVSTSTARLCCARASTTAPPWSTLWGVLGPWGGASQRGLCAGGPHPLPGGPVSLWSPTTKKTAGEVLDLLEQWGTSGKRSGALARCTRRTSCTCWQSVPFRPWSFTRISPD